MLVRWLTPVVLLVLVIASQWLGGAFDWELTRHSDEPAHFITAAMIHDYVADAPGSNPLAFAKAYYCHYPKVAFGHWPPVVHVLLAGWFLLTGVSIPAAFALMGLFAASMAICLTTRARTMHGDWFALCLGVTFLSLTYVRMQLTEVMLDLPLTLWCFLAVFAFADLLATRKLRDAILFSLWSSLAILTKPNGLALALLPLLAIALTRTWPFLRSWKLWLTALIVGGLCGPSYYFFWNMAGGVSGTTGERGLSQNYMLNTLQTVPPKFLVLAGLPLLVFATIGAMRCLSRRVDPTDPARRVLTLRVAVAWVGAVVLFYVVSPITGEARYLLPLLPAVLLLAGEGIRALGEFVSARIFSLASPAQRRAGFLVAVFVFGLLLAFNYNPTWSGFAGYREIARAIPVEADGRVLIVSDPQGEGAFIVERRLQDRDRTSFVLRASKVLASDTWLGGDYRTRFHSTDEVRAYLREVAIDYLVIDESPYGEVPAPEHHVMLTQMLHEYPYDFPLVGEFQLTGRGETVEWAKLYRNKLAEGRPRGEIRIDMKRKLGGEISR
jgi:4-amino-4-deoxy-L-arabinose transferase-like glycosyltransferase